MINQNARNKEFVKYLVKQYQEFRLPLLTFFQLFHLYNLCVKLDCFRITKVEKEVLEYYLEDDFFEKKITTNPMLPFPLSYITINKAFNTDTKFKHISEKHRKKIKNLLKLCQNDYMDCSLILYENLYHHTNQIKQSITKGVDKPYQK